MIRQTNHLCLLLGLALTACGTSLPIIAQEGGASKDTATPRAGMTAAAVTPPNADTTEPLTTTRPDSSTAAIRPNIVLIMADDMGLGDLGCYNPKSKIKTPHLDQLAAEGMRMTDAHSPSAVCSPTRYGLLTGRYAWRSPLKRGVLWGDSPLLIDPQRATLASMLAKSGYATACIGKWHLGLGKPPEPNYGGRLTPGPNDLGFDEFFGIAASLDQTPYVTIENDRATAPLSLQTPAGTLRRHGGEGFWRAGPIAPGFRHEDLLPRLLDRSIAFIDDHRENRGARPFFLYFPLTAPHTPWVPTPPYQGKSKAGWYGDFIAQIDGTVGEVLAALDRHGIADETLVIVTSDNGSHWTPWDIEKWQHRANLDWRGQKADIHEAGHRVPFVARWPGRIKAGSVSDQLMCHTDLFATVAALLDVELAVDVAEDSLDMSSVFLGSASAPVRTTIVHHSFHGMYAVRDGDWKLIFGRGSGGFTDPAIVTPKPGEPPGQLYNLADDPDESDNLFATRPAVVERLTELMRGFIADGRTRPAG